MAAMIFIKLSTRFPRKIWKSVLFDSPEVRHLVNSFFSYNNFPQNSYFWSEKAQYWSQLVFLKKNKKKLKLFENLITENYGKRKSRVSAHKLQKFPK